MSSTVLLNRWGGRQVISRGARAFPGGREPFHALQHGKFWNGNVSLQMLRQCQFYVATCYLVVLAEVEVGVQVS